ncbi:Cloroperoxidase [Aureobasidium pullulans]|uniref:Cloroperoxidase n=1 Tax=Aureobasidium pullulans TaxID=5580 RepID=A0A4S8VJ08_AURPU|nr:Cloroperoxidase [Aureobasidium pullulans]
MKFTVAATTLSFALASAFPQKNAQVAMPDDIHAWHPAGANDLRGPCPMMNTLANHGFIPRNGGNITKHNAVKGLADGLNFDAALASLMWDQAIIANPEPNATFFTLEHLNQHNVLEHDASLSRMDAYYGNNRVFNPEAFATSTRYWTDETLTANMLANSKLARMVESRAFNPDYTFTANNEQFSLGEVAAPFIAFGNTTSVTVPRDLVLYFFEHERLPHELGWSKKNETMTLKDILNVVSSIRNATSLLTPESASNQTADGESHGIPEGAQVARRSLHLPGGV